MAKQYKKAVISSKEKPKSAKPTLVQQQIDLRKEEPPVFRLAFISLAIAMLIGMMIMSYNAGMSGDEDEHYAQAEKVLKYYTSFGKDTSALVSPALKLYGQSFDLLTVIVVKVFKIDKIYETRHVMNSVFGWLAILFTALIAVELIGWRAGLIGLFLMFISPVFLGHSFNNPKDIPYAMGYVMSLYYMIKWLKEMPRPTIKTSFMVALGIAIGISIRIGGLLSIAYFGLFVAMYFVFTTEKLKTLFNKENFSIIKRVVVFFVGISMLGYFLGILLWPYGIEAPLKNPIKALTEMTNFAVSLRQIFEGNQIWSDNVPWYYSSKYILISVPIIVILGVVLFFRQFFIKQKNLRTLLLFILFFAVAFPLFYIVWKKSNVFGGWRHVMFVYPPMVAMAAIGIGQFFDIIKKKVFVYITLSIVLALSFNPIRHIVANFPYQYIYFNEFTGGVKGAYGIYESDYYYNGLRGGCEWFAENVKPDANKTNQPIIISSNHTRIVSYFLRNLIKDKKVVIHYARYYERGNTDWDYYIVANSYLNPFQLKNNIFPPKKTIYTVNVDGTPICAVVKRIDKSDYMGFLSMNKKDYPSAIELFNKAISLDPNNEAALLNLTEAYFNMQNIIMADSSVNKLLNIYPDYENALLYKGWIYMQKNDFNNALNTFKRIEAINYKYYMCYYGAANVYLRMNDVDSALLEIDKLLQQNQGFKPAYSLLVNIFQFKAQSCSQKGDQRGAQENSQKAQEYINIANQLQ